MHVLPNQPLPKAVGDEVVRVECYKANVTIVYQSNFLKALGDEEDCIECGKAGYTLIHQIRFLWVGLPTIAPSRNRTVFQPCR